MNVSVPPGYDAFRAAFDAGRGTLAWARGVADLETPVAAFLKLAHGRPNAFLLESVEGGAARGRYSVIGMEPDLIWRCRNGRAEINRDACRAAGRLRRRSSGRRSTACARSSPRRSSTCPRACRRCRAASSAISAMTWCA